MTDIVIATRSINKELFRRSGELLDLPFPRIKFVDTTALGYFYEISKLEADWVINIDEDVFAIDTEKIVKLLEFMKANDFICCGVPDGGVIDIRFHNPLAVNACFSIHNNKEIRKRFNQADIDKTHCTEELKQFTPTHLLKTTAYDYDEFEPYYPFFFWLLKQGRMLYLDAIQWVRDGISTIVTDHERQPILLHCWYGRDYENQKQRFDYAFNFCTEVRRQNAQKKAAAIST